MERRALRRAGHGQHARWVVKVDDYTIRTFAQPNPLFLFATRGFDGDRLRLPRQHYWSSSTLRSLGRG